MENNELQGFDRVKYFIVAILLTALTAFLYFSVINFVEFFLLVIILLLISFRAKKAIIKEDSESVSLSDAVLLQKFIYRLPVALFFISSAGRIVFANDACRKLFPHIKEGLHYSTLSRVPNYIDNVGAALAGNEVESFFVKSERGFARVFELVISRVFDEFSGVLDAVMMVEVYDKSSEIRLKEMQRDFVANASHELRTPLSTIKAGIETIELYPKDEKVVEHFLPILGKQAERMAVLIDDLMSLSKIELLETTSPQEKVNISQLVAETTKFIQNQFSHVEIVNNYGHNIDVVTGDASQLQQVFENILTNGIKYAGDSGSITIERLSNHPSHLQMIGVSFLDKGPGIAAEDIPRLTDRFFRVSKTDNMAKDGTGLGLAIVKHILKRHDAELQVESNLGKGSRFTVWLRAEANEDQ